MASGCAVFPTATAGAPDVCDAQLRLSPSSREAPVTLTAPAAASFVGTLNVTKNETAHVAIDLSTVVSTGWPTSLSLSRVELGNGSHFLLNFTVNVTVPADWPLKQPAQLTLIARFDASGGGCDGGTAMAQAIVSAAPAFGAMSVMASPSEANVEGANQVVAVIIEAAQRRNFDSTAARWYLEAFVAQVRIEGPEGFVVEAPQRVDFLTAENDTVHATLAANFSFPHLAAGTYLVSIRVWAGAQNESSSGSATVTVHILASIAEGQLVWGILVGAAAVGAFAVWLWRERSAVGPK